MLRKIGWKIKREQFVRKIMGEGATRTVALNWYKAVRRDDRKWRKLYPQNVLDNVHNKGYLAKNIERANILEEEGRLARISDLDYQIVLSGTNSFAKWIEDINTMTRMLPQYACRLPKIYFSISQHDGVKILDYPVAEKKRTAADIIDCVRQEKKPLQLRPAFWNSAVRSYTLSVDDKGNFLVNQTRYSDKGLKNLLNGLSANYLLCEKIDYSTTLPREDVCWAYLKFYIVNKADGCTIACALVNVAFDPNKKEKQYLINREDGTFDLDGETQTIPRWREMTKELCDIGNSMKQLQYFSISVVLTEDGYKISKATPWPILPRIPYDKELNDFLLQQAALQKENAHGYSIKQLFDRIKEKRMMEKARPGIRPYMQKLWLQALKEDKHTRSTTKAQKKWAWKRGFLSFRIAQYGLTDENYLDFLSDYDYFWLNRINNVYQGWISDKTTFRYTMDPMKEFIPRYYFSVIKRNNEMCLIRMQDCPADIEANQQGVVELLKREQKLVFKPSAGTHGDGFYCLEMCGDDICVNGEKATEAELMDLLRRQKSFYIIESYIYMHPELKKIYPKSVNSVRMMLINRHGYDPKIMQTYIRIGSSATGYTDNVGYGGIAAMVDKKTGRLYAPETLKDHVYSPCPTHPDTGVAIEGVVVPYWDLICQKVLEICRLMPELEYLGFDIAVTEDGFNVMEINIHQDLHKVANHSDEIRAYYKEQIEYKRRLNKI